MSAAVSEHVFPAAYTHDENRQRFATLLGSAWTAEFLHPNWGVIASRPSHLPVWLRTVARFFSRHWFALRFVDRFRLGRSLIGYISAIRNSDHPSTLGPSHTAIRRYCGHGGGGHARAFTIPQMLPAGRLVRYSKVFGTCDRCGGPR